MYVKPTLRVLCLILLLNQTVTLLPKGRTVTQREAEELNREHRNSKCCKKKLSCCVPPKPPTIAIRAILARCPKSQQTRNIDKPIMSSMEENIRHFPGFDDDEPLVQSRVTKCSKKILISLKLHHIGTTNCNNQFIVIDHVYDSLTERSVRLLNPYVIKIKQQPVSKSFYLKFIDFVNSEAYEQVYNKQDYNYTGCFTDKHHATCGIVQYEGKPIPYSEGFCCSCDTKQNAMRQPQSLNSKNEEIISYSDPAYLFDRVECPRNFDRGKLEEEYDRKNGRGNREAMNANGSQSGIPEVTTSKQWLYRTFGMGAFDKSKSSSKHKGQDCIEDASKYLSKFQVRGEKQDLKKYIEDVKKAHFPVYVQNYLDELREKFGEHDKVAKQLIRKIRQVYSSGVQIRGGQNCANRYTPANIVDPTAYHESTHCLRFSDVWYGIYRLGDPTIQQTVEINIFERFDTVTSSDKWREITNHTVNLSSRLRLWEDEQPTISLVMNTKTLTDVNKYSKLHTRRILIPEQVPESIRYRHLEILNGPDEYLVVKPDQIAVEGDQCDRIGVGFEAFYKQPRRCNMPKFTCLHNQPKHLWKHDRQLVKMNRIGCYFLKYHANITKEPILINQTSGEKFLEVEYDGAHITNIDMEIRADFNSIVRHFTTAAITEVYVDSTCEKVTTLIIKVTNTGLLSNEYLVRMVDFPLEVAQVFGNIRSKKHLIPPQNQHIYTLEVRNKIPTDLLFCTVEVLNNKNEIVALRRVRIQKFDRCVCTWHCLCACVSSPLGLKCRPMSITHYHAAGFQGSLPITSYVEHFTMLDDLVSVSFYFLLFLLVTLLVLGLTKGLMGLCCASVGMWGLSVMLDMRRPMRRYHERSLKYRKIVYDCNGIPVHPDTGGTVRVISHGAEFCTNLTFFYTYPLFTTFTIIRRCCCPYYTSEPKSHIQFKAKPNRSFSKTSTSSRLMKPSSTKETVCSRLMKQHESTSVGSSRFIKPSVNSTLSTQPYSNKMSQTIQNRMRTRYESTNVANNKLMKRQNSTNKEPSSTRSRLVKQHESTKIPTTASNRVIKRREGTKKHASDKFMKSKKPNCRSTKNQYTQDYASEINRWLKRHECTIEPMAASSSILVREDDCVSESDEENTCSKRCVEIQTNEPDKSPLKRHGQIRPSETCNMEVMTEPYECYMQTIDHKVCQCNDPGIDYMESISEHVYSETESSTSSTMHIYNKNLRKIARRLRSNPRSITDMDTDEEEEQEPEMEEAESMRLPMATYLGETADYNEYDPTPSTSQCYPRSF